MVQNTRKAKSRPFTIPQLRKAFDHIDHWVQTHCKKGKTKAMIPAFQAEWKKTFRRSVDAKAAEAYLVLKQKSTRKKQRGGSMLAGAPLDYALRPGVTGPYGSFPAYVSSGMLSYPEDSFSMGCGKIDSTPKLPVGLGSNLVKSGGYRRKTRKQGGGGSTLDAIRSTVEVMTSRPFQNGAPSSPGSTVQMGLKGVEVTVPHPSQLTFAPQAYDPLGFKSSPAALSVNLPAQVRV
jgi:hypothetical protein